MLGKIHCWAVRKLGGNHRWGKAVFADMVLAAEMMKQGAHGPDLPQRIKACGRCGATSIVKQRKGKQNAT